MADPSLPDRPLAGVRVLELARILAGPWAGQLLADLGAVVVKVERPGSGDDTRQWGPPFLHDAAGQDLGAAYFHACNRGKQSVALDLRDPANRARVVALAAESDVVIENFRRGALVRHGLDHASLSARFPRLIYCSITGFGQTGPYADRAGYDAIVQAMSGIMDLTGAPDGPPQKIGVAYADILTGVYAAVAILAALHRRGQTGRGGHIDMALMDCMVGTLANQAMNQLAGAAPTRMGNAHPNIVPYQDFATADGPIMVAVGNDGQFARFCAAIGLPALAGHPDYATNAERVAHRQALIGTIAPVLRGQNRAALLAALETAGVPAGPINTVAQMFADPQVIARGMRLDLAGGRTGDGTVIPGVACPIVLDGQRMVCATAAPRLGGRPVRD